MKPTNCVVPEEALKFMLEIRILCALWTSFAVSVSDILILNEMKFTKRPPCDVK